MGGASRAEGGISRLRDAITRGCSRLRRPLSSKISRTILLWISIASLAPLGVSLWAIERQSHRAAIEELREDQATITRGQAVLLADVLAESEEIVALSALSGVLANPEIVGVRLSDPGGGERYAFGETEDASGFVHSEPITAFDGETFSAVGEITTYATDRRIAERVADRRRSLAAMVGALLCAVIVATVLIVDRVVGRPVAMLEDAVVAGRRGELRRVSWPSDDEMGLLAGAFDQLQYAQHARIDDLRAELMGRERLEAERMRGLANAASEGLIIHAGGEILDANEAMARMAGLLREEVVGGDVRRWAPAAVIDASGEARAHHEITRADGEKIAVELHSRPIDHLGRPARVIAARDVTEQLAAEARIRHLALHDDLTDLPNRRAFHQRLRAALQRGEGCGFSLLAMDLDGFKAINDRYGHAAGDAMLVSVARRLQRFVRADDMVARLGGDEFVLLRARDDGDEDGDRALAERIVEAMCAPFALEIGDCRIGVSIGVARFPEHASVEDELLRVADAALYEAKGAGRNVHRLARADRDLAAAALEIAD